MALSISRNWYVTEYILPWLSDSERARLHKFHSEVAVVFIDEISTVLKIRLIHIYKRLCEISGCLVSQPYGNLFLFVVGNLLQLSPNKSSPNI